ncbi:discoidin domain-containing protein [Kibdelosporangium philippinense]|uniref:Discoidin domain-containing protein n=1 Tax=Kibdelosporangium philippinense TaxID=211113 RepID=A0ABS8ZRS5_9PSEU|nr:CARDB domain-containing protein [Kibdelosporangium philippinense]MCE7010444.1 discoidin domain-containing protein [Kibdelosporangium philippinense]
MIPRRSPRGLAVATLVAGLVLAGTAVPALAADTNLAVGRSITASSVIGNFAATKANDDDPTSYWEAAPDTYPNTLTVSLGANADITSIGLRLNPAPEWGPRTQTVEVLGREQSSSAFTSLVASTGYTFDPATGNRVDIPVSAKVADVQLRITGNTGGSGGQIAEFQVFGTPAPNPDLTVTGVTAPATSEDSPVTATATVANVGPLASDRPTNVTFYVDGAKVATSQVGPLAAGASVPVSASLGRFDAGARQLSARVDEATQIFEENEQNNSSSAVALVVTPVRSADLVADVRWESSSLTAVIRNQGTVPTAGIVQPIVVTVEEAYTGKRSGTFFGISVGRLAPGASSQVSVGKWHPRSDGKYIVRSTVSVDSAEVPIKRANNVSARDVFVGCGSAMPYDTYEAEDAALGGGAAVVGPNRTIGDLAGEASGRKAVTLNKVGSSVEFTTRKPTNTLVTRFSLPDAPAGGGMDSSLDVYVNGKFLKPIPLTSQYTWLYGPETWPVNDPAAGPPRHIYDEANLLLGVNVPAGSKIKLVNSRAVSTAVDFVSVEQVAPVANPDPARFVTPTGFTHDDVQSAVDKVRTDITGALQGVYLPEGSYTNPTKLKIAGTAMKVIGAGPWFTRFHAPATQDNTDAGFDVAPSASGSTFTGFSYFGNYKTRIDGPGKVFDLTGVSGLTFDNLWIEHTVVGIWGSNVHQTTVRNSRFRNTFADAVNLTNGSSDNHVINNEARTTGDDSFALWAATDIFDGDQKNNLFEHLTAILPWRAAGIAVYGGQANMFKNIYIADTLAGTGATISSLSFAAPMRDFGPAHTVVSDVTIVRAGGHFFGAQTFPALWLFSATNKFQAIRVSNIDIVDPTYSGIMFQSNYVNGQLVNRIQDTELRNITITGARKSGDEFDAKSGFGLWANEFPEPGQGPAVGEVTFHGLKLKGNHTDIRNTTSTFTIHGV